VSPLTEREVRASFVNASRGEVSRMRLPDLDEVAWESLDFLGWSDPRTPQQAQLVTTTDEGAVGVALRRHQLGGGRARMCSLCLTTHPGSGVTLLVAARAGKAGRDGNTVGLDICADLRCSAYVRGLVPLPVMSRVPETLPLEDKVARLRLNLDAFLRRVRR
jgi:hypothetical protein